MGLIFLIFNLVDFDGYVKIYFSGFLLVLLMIIIHLIYHHDFNVLPSFKEYQSTYLKEMFSWSVYGLITGLSGFAAIKIDTIMINDYLGEAATGIYVTVFNFTTLILMPNRGMSRIASTIISDAFKINDYKKVDDMYERSCLTQAVIAILIYLGLVVNIDNIFRILPEPYAAAYWVIVIIGLANVLRMVAGVSENIIALSQYYKYQTYFIVFYLLTIVLFNLILIPIYGLIGAAVASGISIGLYFIVRYIFLYIKFRYQPYSLKYVSLVLISFIVYFLIGIIPYSGNLILDIAIRSLLTVVIYLLAVYFLRLSFDINTLVEDSLEFIIAKIKRR